MASFRRWLDRISEGAVDLIKSMQISSIKLINIKNLHWTSQMFINQSKKFREVLRFVVWICGKAEEVMGECKTIGRVGHKTYCYWLFRLEKESNPDLALSLLHQKLQMIQFCIMTKRKRHALLDEGKGVQALLNCKRKEWLVLNVKEIPYSLL